MFGMKFDVAKQGFFDREAVTSKVDSTTKTVFSKFGAFVRTGARRSIRKRKKSSAPGQPPSSHTGKLSRFIFFSFDAIRKSVVIGPVRVASKDANAPSVLEHSGDVKLETKAGTKTVHVEARPFMGPAYAREEPKLPGLWRNAIK